MVFSWFYMVFISLMAPEAIQTLSWQPACRVGRNKWNEPQLERYVMASHIHQCGEDIKNPKQPELKDKPVKVPWLAKQVTFCACLVFYVVSPRLDFWPWRCEKWFYMIFIWFHIVFTRFFEVWPIFSDVLFCEFNVFPDFECSTGNSNVRPEIPTNSDSSAVPFFFEF